MPRRSIDSKMWTDNWFTSLDPIERYLFQYFLTNEHTTLCGIYELPLRIMAFESGLEIEMLLKIIKRFSEDNKVYYYEGWICVVNYEEHQIMNPNMKTNANNSRDLLPPKVVDYFEQLSNSSKQLENSNGTLLSKDKDKDKDNRGIVKGGNFGREDINEVISYLSEKIGGSPDGSQQNNRRFAKLLIDKFKKDYPEGKTEEQIKFLIDASLQDSFHAKNATSFSYLYYNAQKILQTIKNKPKFLIKI